MARLVRNGNGPIMQSTAPEWLEKLMLRVALMARLIGPEDKQCILFADRLREAALLGKLRCVWTHIPHEVGGGTKNAALRYSLAAALGLITGSYDYVITWRTGSMWIEFKRAAVPASHGRKHKSGGSLTEKQKLFGQWCDLNGVPHHVVNTASQALKLLIDEGLLDV